jgi:hypothetical protein
VANAGGHFQVLALPDIEIDLGKKGIGAQVVSRKKQTLNI